VTGHVLPAGAGHVDEGTRPIAGRTGRARELSAKLADIHVEVDALGGSPALPIQHQWPVKSTCHEP
jgi:hypothetical protein